jgi:uncharacterized protein YndB with AHSA1/START domain
MSEQKAQFGHANSVRFERTIKATASEIWAVLTDTSRLSEWYGIGTIEPGVGGAVSLMDGHVRGVVTHWQPEKKLTYTWNVFQLGQEVSDFPESYLTLEVADGKLVLTHLPVLEEFVKLNAMGWHTFLDMVEAAATGGKVEERSFYMERNAETYGVKLPS